MLLPNYYFLLHIGSGVTLLTYLISPRLISENMKGLESVNGYHSHSL